MVLQPVWDGVPPPMSRRVRPVTPAPRDHVETPDGHRIAYAQAGHGPDLVLIHGALLALEDIWLGPMSALARHFRLIAFDRPGHGDSTRARLVDASPWRQAEILGDAMRALGLRRPIVIGHSFGAAVALSLAMSRPEEIAGAVALAPICFPELRLEQVLFGPRAVPVAGDALNHTLGAAADSATLPLLWRAMYLPQSMPPRVAAEYPFAWSRRPGPMIANGEDAAALWPALTRSALSYASCRAPVQILAGDADLVVNTALHGANAARLIPGARFDRLPGIGHMVHHARPQAVVDAARAMLGA